MKIHLIAVGKQMPPWVEEAVQEYSKRLTHYCDFTLTTIATAKRHKQAEIASLMAKEGEAMRAAMSPNFKTVVLAVEGKLWSTPTLAKKLQTARDEAQHLNFLIGGPDGLDPACVALAHEQWSLSALTLPHALVRVIVLEQLYRAWTILHKHPYHR